MQKGLSRHKTGNYQHSIEKLIPGARFTLGSQDHVFRIGGKTSQLSDLHNCNDHEIGFTYFIKIQIESEIVNEDKGHLKKH